MAPRSHKLRWQVKCLAIALVSGLVVMGGGNTAHSEPPKPLDSLYITNVGDNTVKEFDAQGNFKQTIVSGVSPQLNGPMGVLVKGNSLIVSNQNFGAVAGEIYSYNRTTGNLARVLVPGSNPDVPFAPRGIVLKDEVLYIADVIGSGSSCVQIPAPCPPGQIVAFRPNGKLVGKLTAANSAVQPLLQGPLQGQFHPRGVVLGPDGYLYFSVRNFPEICGGSILKASLDLKTVSVVVSNSSDCAANVNDLHRPEGLVFGPDGKLYVTSFIKDGADTDKILIFDQKGKKLGHIELDVVGQPRAFAQAILFGPDGYLYVPIQNTGEVRRCDVTKPVCLENSQFIPPGILARPNYLTFGKTNPATLEYSGK